MGPVPLGTELPPEGWVIPMTNETLLLIGAAVVGLPGAINTIGSAVEKIVKAKKAINAPNDEQDREIADLKRRVSDLERGQKSEIEEIEDIHECNRITALALIALLDHGLDGNNIKQMNTAKDELNNYLTRR